MTRNLKKKELSEECEGSVSFHEFKGKKAKDIVRYMDVHLMEEQPKSVVFVAGGNDLNNNKVSQSSIEEIANTLVDAGRRCQEEFGVSNVTIAGILPRSDPKFQGNRHRLNIVLKDLCRVNNFSFLCNDNIVLKHHGHYDGVHLNQLGSSVLYDNLLDVINENL